MFEIMERDSQEAVIKVIGVGGCGGNAVEHMMTKNVSGVEFICANTDMQALKKSHAKTVLQIGQDITKGLGAGAKPEIGREAALEDRDRIAEIIDGADMLFITAGMGGGTGTGAAPIIAEVAKEMGILTVAVVTKPFAFEGKRTKVAADGLEELSQHVDSLIVIPNEKLMEVLGEDVPFLEAFRAANDVLHNAVSGIAEIINCPGLVNVDFADVRTVMSEMGMAMMGSAEASGPDRARIAAEQAVASPLLEDVNLANARGVLVNISASTNFKMKEYYDVMNTIKAFTAEDATVIVGNVMDENMGDKLRVTMVATGLNGAVARRQQKPELKVMTTVRDGTTNQPIYVGMETEEEAPAVFTSNNRRAQVEAMKMSGVEEYDIPAFLRKQAD
ncbi:cell division protein FtsZ [Methylophilaceae bacterium 11]|jgi:cell division protein FtsZ|uniref:cell division protein FtsZ n=1 Tax=unclassified Methylotenera TaxID=2643294 RepID=UPI00035DE514|nr:MULTISPECIES: cell division protein FtsZ [unclassified Methylotenera]EUJ11440.1 cell division protein FtsZ [Methylophilaceae bacterium 11]